MSHNINNKTSAPGVLRLHLKAVRVVTEHRHPGRGVLMIVSHSFLDGFLSDVNIRKFFDAGHKKKAELSGGGPVINFRWPPFTVSFYCLECMGRVAGVL